jgi:hypothetical protein
MSGQKIGMFTIISVICPVRGWTNETILGDKIEDEDLHVQEDLVYLF